MQSEVSKEIKKSVFIPPKKVSFLPDNKISAKYPGQSKDPKINVTNLETKNVPYDPKKIKAQNVYAPKSENNDLFVDPFIKGHSLVGGFDSLAGKGNVGKPDSMTSKETYKEIIKPFDTIDLDNKLTHYNKYQNPVVKLAKEKPGFTVQREDFKVGLCKGTTYGNKSNIDKIRNDLIFLPPKGHERALKSNELEISNQKEVAVPQPTDPINIGFRARRGYQTDVVPHDEFGQVLPLEDPARNLATFAHGEVIMPRPIKFKVPYGISQGGKYQSGKGTTKINYNPV